MNDHALLTGFLRCFHGIVLVVFTVGNDDQCFVLVVFPDKRLHGKINRSANGRSLCGYNIRIDGGKEKFCCIKVGGNRKLNISLAGKYNYSYTVILQLINES